MSAYTWPDGTRKSQSNAFNWRGKPSMLAKPTAAERSSIAQTLTPRPGRSITVYSRAKGAA